MTTFIIISCVFRDIYSSKLGNKARDFITESIQDRYDEGKRKLTLLTAEHHQTNFEQTVLKGLRAAPTNNFEKEFPNNKYLQNAHYIKSLLDEKIKENQITVNDFVIWIFEKVVLTVITCPSQDRAIQIFNVLNDRGMALSSIDILKSSLMQKLDGIEDRNSFKATWTKFSENLKFRNFDLDGMLNSYLYYRISTNPKQRLDKELLDVFKKEDKDDALAIIQNISEFSLAYIEILTTEDKSIYCLRYLKHEIYWRSILSTALFSKYPDLEKLKSLLVAYYYQNWIAGATVARIKQTSFNILKLVKAKESIDEIKSEMQDSLKKYSTTKSFKEEIEGNLVYGRRWDRAVLLLIEYFSSDESKQSFISIGNKLHLEHVLPQTPTDEWKKIFSDEELKMWTDSLANLTLLSMKKNVQAQNNTFREKIEIYKNKDNVRTSFLITQDIIESNKWEVADLERRKESLLGKVMKKLDLFS